METGKKPDGRRRISREQEDEAVRLYESGLYSLDEIMAKSGIRSSQTIYRILAERNTALRTTGRRVNITLDTATTEILERVKPRNLSGLICRLIKREYGEK